MQSRTEAPFAARLALLTNTFRYRCGPMALLAALFTANEAPRLQAFGVAIFGWIMCELLVKLYIDAKKAER